MNPRPPLAPLVREFLRDLAWILGLLGAGGLVGSLWAWSGL